MYLSPESSVFQLPIQFMTFHDQAMEGGDMKHRKIFN